MHITVYTTPTCPYCQQAKSFLSEKGIQYTEIDVSENEEAARKMIEKTKQMGVPVMLVEREGSEELIIGFDREKLEKILSNKI
ncbi:TPA: hypothetical protein DCZ32_04870 [Candidatus Uhrbacteria bacterium]|nr:hypothetical protein [Candidatus Uhrbacteria bacterium]